MSDLLPAVVLGIDTPIGLSIIRDLGSRGVAVTGLGRHARSLGMASRFLHQGLVRADTEQALINQLIALSEALGPACLFAVSESDIELLNRHRPRLSAYRLLLPDAARMQCVLNKEQTYAAAVRVGIAVPRTEQPTSIAHVEEFSASLCYPVVLKWSNPNQAQFALRAAGLALDKTHYCDNREELLAYLRPYEAVNIYPLVQEYCPGYGLGQFILMHDGQPRYTFQHRRVHEWPPEGGFSSLCESVSAEAHPELLARSVALLKELRWEGVAMVEYRHDPRSGRSALMEINGRYWGSLPLARHAGAAFPWFAYLTMGLGRPVDHRGYRSGLRCRFMIPETKRLLRILFAREKIADKTLHFSPLRELCTYLMDFVRADSRYYVFEWRDPAPFFADLRQMAAGLLRRDVR